MNHFYKLWLFSLITAAIAFSACDNNDKSGLPKPPQQCEVDRDCLSDESCKDNVCVLRDSCEDDEDCQSTAWFCAYPAQRCEMRAGFAEECSAENPCDPGFFCALGKCRDTQNAIPCARRTDCPLGQICDRSTFYCIEEAPCTLAEAYPELACEPNETCDEISGLCRGDSAGECTQATVEEDCGPNRFCDATNRCVQCLDDTHCGAGLICNSRAGRCESEDLCYDDADCPPHLFCDLATALCQVPPPACEDDFDCEIAEICNRTTGRCELLEGVCIDDYLEDADSPSNAEEVNFAEDSNERLYDGLMLCPDDDDLFAVNLSAGDNLHVEVTNTDIKARATLWLLDSAGETSLQYVEAPPRGDGTIDYLSDVDQTVYLRLNALLGATDYNLSIAITQDTPCLTDDYETEAGNDTYITAFSLPTSNETDTLTAAICTDDTDHYIYTLAAGEAVNATLTFDGNQTDLDLAFLDPDDGELLYSSSGIGDQETLTYRAQEAMTLVVRVKAYHNNKGDYTLTFNRVPAFACPTDQVTEQVLDLTTPYAAPETALCIDTPLVYSVTVEPYQRVVALANFNSADLTLGMAVVSDDETQNYREAIYRTGQGSITYQPWNTETVKLKHGAMSTHRDMLTSVFFLSHNLNAYLMLRNLTI